MAIQYPIKLAVTLKPVWHQEPPRIRLGIDDNLTEIDLTEKDGIWKHAGRHVFTGLYNEQDIDTDIRNHQLTWGDASTATDVSDILFSSKGQGRILVPSIYYVTDSLLDPSIQSFGDVRISNYIDAGFPKVGEVYKTHYNTRPPVINGDGSVGFMNEFITEETL